MYHNLFTILPFAVVYFTLPLLFKDERYDGKDVYLTVLLSGLLGGRLSHVLLNLESYNSILSFITVQQGQILISMSIFCSMLAAYWTGRKHQLNLNEIIVKYFQGYVFLSIVNHVFMIVKRFVYPLLMMRNSLELSVVIIMIGLISLIIDHIIRTNKRLVVLIIAFVLIHLI